MTRLPVFAHCATERVVLELGTCMALVHYSGSGCLVASQKQICILKNQKDYPKTNRYIPEWYMARLHFLVWVAAIEAQV